LAAVTGACGHTTGLVGPPGQVAETSTDHYEAGVSTFLILGFGPPEDAGQAGRELLPLIRADATRTGEGSAGKGGRTAAMTEQATTDWRHDGVRVVPGDQLDTNTPQTPGMNRAAAINFARVGAQKLWAGTVTIHAHAKTGAHHHGELESVIYVLRGRARMRWGNQLEFTAEAGPGDFIYVPPFVPHQEINASDTEPLECVLVRSDQEAVVVNLDIPMVEKPETVAWIDPIHKAAGGGEESGTA
jgi:uncharacterized RmlC-like cupin family protein